MTMLISILLISVFEIVNYKYNTESALKSEIISHHDKNSRQLLDVYESRNVNIKKQLSTFSKIVSNSANVNKFDNIVSIANVFKNEFNLVEVAYASINGEVYTSTGKLPDFNAKKAKREWFSEVVERGVPFYQSGVYRSAVDNKLSITVSSPVFINNEISGVVLFDLLGDSIMEHSNKFILSDERGRVISSSSDFYDFLGESIYNISDIYKSIGDGEIVTYDSDDGIKRSVKKTRLGNVNIYSIIELNDFHNELINDVLYDVTSSLIILVIIWIVVAFILKRELKPINDVLVWLAELSKGDLSLKNYKKNNNELDRVFVELSKFVEIFVGVISRTNDTIDSLKKEQVTFSSAIKGNSENSKSELLSVEQVATASTELACTASEVSRYAVDSEVATRNVNQAIDNNSKLLNDSNEIVQQINDSIDKASVVVNDLKFHTEKINNVLSVINNISEQTNLLALNAAIEAARAGEQGRGFAVVADEVRALAAKTQSSTIDIQEIITELQEQASMAGKSMQDNVILIQDLNRASKYLITSFSDMSEHVEILKDVNTLVATASEEQSSVTLDISNQLENISQLVNSNAASLNNTSESNQITSSLVHRLSIELSHFKVR